MATSDRQHDKVIAFVPPLLQPGEQVVADVPFAQTGPNQMWSLLLRPLLFLIRYWALVQTNRRLILLKRGSFTTRIKSVAAEFQSGQCYVAQYAPGTLWNLMTLAQPGKPVVYRVHRVNRARADAFVAAVGSDPRLAPPPPSTNAPTT